MNTTQDGGGPAFPTQNGTRNDAGMTLRDWFAGMFIQGGDPMEFDIRDRHEVAKYAYLMADAMLAARKEQP